MSIIRDNCIFIHIPKCAGTSMEKAFGRDCLGHAHQTVQEMVTMGLDEFGNEYDINLPILCFVRNPYDRLISSFCYRFYTHKFYHKCEYGAHPRVLRTTRPLTAIAFEEFIRNVDSVDDMSPPELMNPFRTQFSFVSKDGKLAATHIYRFENLYQDFRTMADEFFPSYKDISLPHENRTEVRLAQVENRRGWKSFFKNKEVKDKVDELYRIDFNTFNYPMVIQ